ncbi:hypothetical protein HMI54_008678 [Coelomomyces lativittatus]|nr:hypothetical protein HMI56_003353 [Coelomomyces lativittatus]KAJ1502786.1 hypothetical protein HMI54_008678 [Coelomomyces lativittatus]KAJ1517504.1 hypothetical protein HMI55_006890 [Coelomomyces lativittatus]
MEYSLHPTSSLSSSSFDFFHSFPPSASTSEDGRRHPWVMSDLSSFSLDPPPSLLDAEEIMWPYPTPPRPAFDHFISDFHPPSHMGFSEGDGGSGFQDPLLLQEELPSPLPQLPPLHSSYLPHSSLHPHPPPFLHSMVPTPFCPSTSTAPRVFFPPHLLHFTSTPTTTPLSTLSSSPSSLVDPPSTVPSSSISTSTSSTRWSSPVRTSHPKKQGERRNSVPRLPAYEDLIAEALMEMGNGGYPPRLIFNWMESHYTHLPEQFRGSATQALKKAWKKGRFTRHERKYKLNPTYMAGPVHGRAKKGTKQKVFSSST